MRVLVLSWEYPPMTWGGLSYHVYRLSEAVKGQVEEIHVLTQGRVESAATERRDSLYIHRIPQERMETPDFLTQIMALNFQILKKGIPLIMEQGPFHLLHLHDWLVIQAGSVLKHAFHIPLLLTIHATEHGRNNGIHNPLQRYINDLEWLATYEAWKVICCSQYMAGEIRYLFQLPEDKIQVIENGVSLEDLEVEPLAPSFRRRFAHPDEKILFFVGRLVREKGVEDLFYALKILKEKGLGVKAIIAGQGPHKGELESFVHRHQLTEQVLFTGFVDDDLRNSLYAISDVAVFPSLYEPFGIVALEAMAARTPVVVTAVGGLDEIVQDKENGLKVKPNDPQSLSRALLLLFQDESLGERLVQKGYQEVIKEYSWWKVGEKTRQLYQELVEESQSTPWVLQGDGPWWREEGWQALQHWYGSRKKAATRVTH